MASAKLDENEAEAVKLALEYSIGFAKLAALRCVVELEVPDILERHAAGEGTMTLGELSHAIKCSPSFLYRIMRILTHHHIFQEIKINDPELLVSYKQTDVSRALMKNNVGPFFLLMSSPEIVVANLSLSKYLGVANGASNPFEDQNGGEMYKYSAKNRYFREMLKEGVASKGRFTISAMIQNQLSVFEGITSLVDVGGGSGIAVSSLAKACPWISRFINFDLPQVVASLDNDNRVEHIGGDMFQSVPSADAVFIMSVLLHWDDDACVKILKNCKKAIPVAGKLILVETVIDDGNDEDEKKFRDINLGFDIEMVALSSGGKGRTSQEWINVLNTAGFTKHNIKHIPDHQSLIEAYP